VSFSIFHGYYARPKHKAALTGFDLANRRKPAADLKPRNEPLKNAVRARGRVQTNTPTSGGGLLV
jgi:hypothetical protein